jgi:regulatory protein
VRRRDDIDPADARGARVAALDMLARRDRASGQILDELTDKGFSTETAAGVVAALVRENLVNDRRYVEQFIDYHASRGNGPIKVRAELTRTGIDGALVDEFIAAYPDWIARAKEVRQKKFGGREPVDYAGKARQSRFLAYRGFTGSQIRTALGFDVDYET